MKPILARKSKKAKGCACIPRCGDGQRGLTPSRTVLSKRNFQIAFHYSFLLHLFLIPSSIPVFRDNFGIVSVSLFVVWKNLGIFLTTNSFD